MKMGIQLYKIDKIGRPVEAIMATPDEAMKLGDDWVLGYIDESIPFPKWDKGNREWVNGEPDNEFLENQKNIKLKELSETCKKIIVSGFTQVVEGNEYTFHYDIEDQQNFSDTMRLFENNMIDKIGWNAYLEEEKVRIQLDKKTFTVVYLAGVKYKTDCLTRLNDVLYPLVDAAENKETVARIYWDTGLPAEELSLKEGESIDDQIGQLSKKDKDLEQANMMTMMALVQISGQIK